MICNFVILQEYGSPYYYLYMFWAEHPLISMVFAYYAIRNFIRWFFGISKIRRAQDRYIEMLEEQNGMLEHQNQMLAKHEDVLGRLGDKYL